MGYRRPVDSNYITDSYTGHKNRPTPSKEPGTDYGVPIGTPVYAIESGRIMIVDSNIAGPEGRRCSIALDDGKATSSIHLSRIIVSLNQRVSRGQIIAYSGASANGSERGVGPHLHQTLFPNHNHTYGTYNTLDLEKYIGEGTGTSTRAGYADHSAELIRFQQKLIRLGHDLGSTGADGVYGEKTKAATLHEQRSSKNNGYHVNLDEDGLPGPATEAYFDWWFAKIGAPTPSFPQFPLGPSEYFGPEAGGDRSISGWHSHNADLRLWQQRMKDRGWPIVVDGYYGDKGAKTPAGNTYDVALAFQKEKGLHADGLIGKITWDAAFTAPVTPAPSTPNPAPTPAPAPNPTPTYDETAATPDLVSPKSSDFPAWIEFDINMDPDFLKADLNAGAAKYYDRKYDPIESHVHWWGKPGQAGTHDGNVEHLRKSTDLSTNFVVSENRITMMGPINKIALTTGKRNPYGWKSENDPTLSEQQYKTMGFLHYIIEKLNPKLRNQPIRRHKEFMATECSEIDVNKVRAYANAFHNGDLEVSTGLPKVVETPNPDPTPSPEPQPTQPDPTLVRNIKMKFNELGALLNQLEG